MKKADGIDSSEGTRRHPTQSRWMYSQPQSPKQAFDGLRFVVVTEKWITQPLGRRTIPPRNFFFFCSSGKEGERPTKAFLPVCFFVFFFYCRIRALFPELIARKENLMGALALCRQLLNWGLNSNNRCCERRQETVQTFNSLT